MNRGFGEMLEVAEAIRADCRRQGNLGPHAKQMRQMVEYGQRNGLFTGDVLNGTASEEYLSLSAEMAACILEVNHLEDIGSIFALPPEKKLEIIRRANKMKGGVGC